MHFEILVPKIIGAEKSQWAEKITPHMAVANNASPSFVYLRQKLLALICRYRMSRKSGPGVRPA